MEDIIGSLKNDTIGQAQADEIRSLWKSVRARPKFKGKTMDEYNAFKSKWDAQDEIRGFAGDTLEDLHRFRAKFGAAQKAKWAEKGWDSAHVDRIYAALSDEMYSAASRSYGDEGVKVLQSAVDGTTRMHRTLDTTRVMKAAAKDKIDSESSFVRAALGTDKDKIAAMKTIVGQEGAPAVQRQIIDDIALKFDVDGGAAAAKRIKKLNESIETFFGADEAAAMRGLGKFVDNIPNEKQGVLRTLLSGGAWLGGAMTAPVTATAGAGVIWRWTRRQDVAAMLQKLETVATDTPMYKALANELTESLMVVAGVEQSRPPMQVDIRQGVAQ